MYVNDYIMLDFAKNVNSFYKKAGISLLALYIYK